MPTGSTPAASARESATVARSDRKFSTWLHRILTLASPVPTQTGATFAQIYRGRLRDSEAYSQLIQHATRNHIEEWPVLAGEIMSQQQVKTVVARFRNRFAWLDADKTLSTTPFIDVVMQLDELQLRKRQHGKNDHYLPCPMCEDKDRLIHSLRIQLQQRGLHEVPADEVCIRLANEWFHANYICGQGETMRNVLREELEHYLQREFDANVQMAGRLWNAILNGPLRYCKPGDNKHHHLYCRPRVEPLKVQSPLSEAGITIAQDRLHAKGLFCDQSARLPQHDHSQVGHYTNRLATTVHGTRQCSTTARMTDLEGHAATHDAGVQTRAPHQPTDGDKGSTLETNKTTTESEQTGTAPTCVEKTPRDSCGSTDDADSHDVDDGKTSPPRKRLGIRNDTLA